MKGRKNADFILVHFAIAICLKQFCYRHNSPIYYPYLVQFLEIIPSENRRCSPENGQEE